MQQIITWAQSNWTSLLAIQQAAFVLLSLVCQLAGWTAASKFFGTYSTCDLGRITRSAQTKATIVNGSIFVALLTTGCGLFSAKKPFSPCPGLYCIEVEIAGVPGYPSLCYASEMERDESVKTLESRGLKVKVYK